MKCRRRVWIPAAVIACLTVAASPVAAASCAASATPVAFGIYTPSQDALGAGVVTVTCSVLTGGPADVAFSIAMTAGAGTYGGRSLVSGGNKLSYNIYTGAGLSSVWGDDTGGSTTVSDVIHATILGTTRSYTAYGRVPAQQTTAATGVYSDTIVVTISY